ncbi:GNAT family N-acetyltransferase [Massilia sp. Root418]|uniref:GNAT family N-acetyltransferase n=1 Tax=Massilia sp. Root418 TaxID=1736532 RepID=UPI0009EAD286
MTDSEIVSFLVQNIGEFTDDAAPDFPRNIQLGLKSGHLVVRRLEGGFAVVARNCGVSYRPPHAELVFLYTDPAARGQGIASTLVQQIKQDSEIGGPIKLLCCGETRRRFFERHGFTTTGVEDDPYEMWCSLACCRGTYHCSAELSEN